MPIDEKKSFIGDDEFIILMDTTQWDGHYLNVSELKTLRSIGVKTCLWIGPMWDEFEREPLAKELNWEYFDDYMERMAAADMKCLVPLWMKQSMRYPAEWYVRRRAGYVFGTFSPWHKKAQARADLLMEMVRDRISSPTCQVISGQNHGGERVLLNEPAYLDQFALKDWQKEHEGEPDHKTAEGAEWLRQAYLKLLVRQQKILVQSEHREIWFALSRYKATVANISCHGCEWIDDYIEAWQKLKPRSINHISFNYFPYGSEYKPVLDEKEKYGINQFVGAEYCEGLRDGNGRKAIKQGLRIICGPTHPYAKHDHLDKWMVDVMQQNIEWYRRKF